MYEKIPAVFKKNNLVKHILQILKRAMKFSKYFFTPWKLFVLIIKVLPRFLKSRRI